MDKLAKKRVLRKNLLTPFLLFTTYIRNTLLHEIELIA
jgi:hypothetical protein